MKQDNQSIDRLGNELGNAALKIGIQGAQRYLQAHNLTADSAALAEALCFHLKANIDQALDEAKEAFECGMHAVGQATFAAVMMQAGIAAAKEVTA